MEKWSKKFDRCIVCGTREIRHKQYGLCERCVVNTISFKKARDLYRRTHGYILKNNHWYKPSRLRKNNRNQIPSLKPKTSEIRCGMCKEWFPATTEFFSRDNRKSTGLHGLCKKCRRNVEIKSRKKAKEFFEKNFMTLTPTSSQIIKSGYRVLYFGNYHILEQRFIIMKHLGRLLERWEEVHHKNRNKLDNRLENLKISPHIEAHNFNSHQTRSTSLLLKEIAELKEKLKKYEK